MSANNTLASIFRSTGTDPAVLTTASSDPKAITLTYDDVKAQSERFRQQTNALFGSEVPVGTVISSFLPNGLSCLLVFLATTLQRCVAAPLNPAMKQAEVEFYLEDAASKAFIVPSTVGEDNEGVKAARKLGVPVWTASWEEGKGVKLGVLGSTEEVSAELSFPPVEPAADDVALLLHTSGTTGRPKAVPLTHGNIARSMVNITNTYKLTKEDRSFIVMPLFHVHGLIGATLSSLYAGGSVVVPPRFSASSFWPEFIASNANWYSAVPTIHQILLRHELPSPVPKIRFIRSCSSALAPTVLHELEEGLGAPVLEAYAMTEASHQMCSNPLPPAKHKPGSVGIPQGVELTILDDEGNKTHLGEVCIRGPNVTHGYLNNPEANLKSFTEGTHWFRTGDQGYIDEEGYVILTGRIKELINRGGEKISPLELDAVLLKCPGVAEAVSFAVNDEMYGQEVNAAVVPKAGATVTEDQVREFMAENVAKFKVPKRVFVADTLPRTATGKIQRRVVAEHFAGPQFATTKGNKQAGKRNRGWNCNRGKQQTNVVRPAVPSVNVKHPHTLPQNPASLISKWATVTSDEGKALYEAKKQATRHESPENKEATKKLVSLSEYLPAASRSKGRSKGAGIEFAPFDEYNPVTPNSYQMYKQWIEEQKQFRIQQQQQQQRPDEENPNQDASDDNEEYDQTTLIKNDVGEPSRFLVLTNMAGEIDELLEKETMEECETYGTVVSCKARIDDSKATAFERIQVLVEFADIGAAVRAREALDQRFFDGRHISATFSPL
ncbi:hypothetical protein GGI12_001058 [Dipsacomyces acuminosporus]|nr:hypothetical protein GGI12_001058 [Dipsacomyces acuminosporus]